MAQQPDNETNPEQQPIEITINENPESSVEDTTVTETEPSTVQSVQASATSAIVESNEKIQAMQLQSMTEAITAVNQMMDRFSELNSQLQSNIDNVRELQAETQAAWEDVNDILNSLENQTENTSDDSTESIDAKSANLNAPSAIETAENLTTPTTTTGGFKTFLTGK